MTRITDRRINRIIDHLDIATKAKPGFDHDAANDLAWLDTNQANETGISGQGTISDPVAAQVMARAGVIDRSNKVEQVVARLEGDSRLLVALLNAGQRRTPAAQDEPLCAGGDPSTWGDPTCGDIVRSEQRQYGTWYDPSGLCNKHRLRRDRHERQADEAA